MFNMTRFVVPRILLVNETFITLNFGHFYSFLPSFRSASLEYTVSHIPCTIK